jgi:tetratricopeptide (TPR) repeat protein
MLFRYRLLLACLFAAIASTFTSPAAMAQPARAEALSSEFHALVEARKDQMQLLTWAPPHVSASLALPMRITGARGSARCVTRLSTTGGTGEAIPFEWGFAHAVRPHPSGVEWHFHRDDETIYYRLSTGDAELTRRLNEMVAALNRACQVAGGAQPATEAEPGNSASTGSASDPLGDCASGTLPPARILAACSALSQRWARETLRTGEQPSLLNQARLHAAQSIAHRQAGDLTAAMAEAERVVERLPSAWVGYALRAETHQARGAYAEALEDWDRALRFDSGRQVVLRGKASTLVSLGREAEALALVDRAAALDPNDASTRNEACWYRAAYHGRELDVARRDCDAAVRLAPDIAAFLDSRGMVGLKQERWEQAWSDYDRAVQLEPGNAHHLFGRGIAALRRGRAAEGQADLAAARRIDRNIDDTFARYAIAP